MLDDDFNNLLLTKALNEVGLQLFYIPRVKKFIDVDLLCKSMDYILPSGPRSSVADLDSIDAASLFGAFCSTYRLSPDTVDIDAFLMLKLQEGEMLNDEGALTRSMDFSYLRYFWCKHVYRSLKISMNLNSIFKQKVLHQ